MSCNLIAEFLSLAYVNLYNISIRLLNKMYGKSISFSMYNNNTISKSIRHFHNWYSSVWHGKLRGFCKTKFIFARNDPILNTNVKYLMVKPTYNHRNIKIGQNWLLSRVERSPVFDQIFDIRPMYLGKSIQDLYFADEFLCLVLRCFSFVVSFWNNKTINIFIGEILLYR
jgi:hypothetical protein